MRKRTRKEDLEIPVVLRGSASKYRRRIEVSHRRSGSDSRVVEALSRHGDAVSKPQDCDLVVVSTLA